MKNHDRQRLGTASEHGRYPPQFARWHRQAKVWQAIEDRVERDLKLDTGQRRPSAEVNAVTEAEVRVG